MRLVFAGTPEFAGRSLRALLDAGHEVSLVLTQPDRPSGRGLVLAGSAVRRLAQERALPLFQPATLKDASAVARVAAARPEVLVVVAYGLILPQAALEVAPLGALNVHASLLPRWRGAAPIQRAILAGDRESGVTIMKMDAGLDSGPMLEQRTLPIAPDDDAGSLHDRLAALGAEMIVAALATLTSGHAELRAQSVRGVTYAHKITKHETIIDWARPAAELERAVRAFRPSPGARTRARGETVKVWRASIVEGQGDPGAVLESGPSGIVVACSKNALALTELQREGARRMGVAELLRGWPIRAGEHFGVAPE